MGTDLNSIVYVKYSIMQVTAFVAEVVTRINKTNTKSVYCWMVL